MEEQVLSLLIKEVPTLVVVLFLAWKIADYFNKLSQKHIADIKDIQIQNEAKSTEKDEKHQADLTKLQTQMNELNTKNLEITMAMYEKQDKSNRENYKRQEEIHKDNIQRLQSVFTSEAENGKIQMENIKMVYEGQEKRLSEMKEEFVDYKQEMEDKRESDRVIFSELLKDEKKVFTDAINAFNGAIIQFEDTTTKIAKLEKDVNSKIDSLEDNVNSIKEMIIEDKRCKM
jgi:hypothetical protein